MEKRSILTEILAIAGTVFTALPVLAPLFFAVAGYRAEAGFRFDWLMPAELFPLALAGGGLLLWAALRARSRRAWIAWSLGLAVGLLVGGQVLAMVTGLASGEIEAQGIWWTLVVGSIGLYALAVLSLAVNGGLLLRDLFRRTEP